MKNLGDQALLQSLKDNYVKKGSKVVVLNNANLLYKFPNLFNADEIISSGGWISTTFQTDLWLTLIALARIINPKVKIRFIGVDVDGLNDFRDFLFTYAPYEYDEFKIRDEAIQDLAFQSKLNSDRKKIGIDIVPSFFKGKENKVKRLIKFFEKEGYEVYLLPFSTLKRTPLMNRRVESDEDFFERIGHKDKIVREYSVNGMKYVISKMDLMICSHYHSHVFAIMEKVPFLSIPYAHKIRKLAERLNFEDKLLC